MTKIANNKLITKRDLAILTAYTGYMFGEFLDFHEYSEELLGHRIFTNEYKNIELTKKLHKSSKQDFLELHEKLIQEAEK